jgi:hypothetical protein
MALNLDTLLMRLNNELERPFRADLSTENLNLHNELIAKTRERLLGFKHKQEPILANRTWSDEGKATQTTQLATAAIKDFTYLNIVASREAATVARLKTTMYTIPMPTTMTDQDAREIRAEYTGLSAQEVDMSFMRLCEQSCLVDADDPDAPGRATEELYALLSKRGRALVSLDIKNRGLSERARRLFPSAFAELVQADMMAEQLSSLRDHVVMWLVGLGAEPRKVFDELGGPEPTEGPMATELKKRQPVSA